MSVRCLCTSRLCERSAATLPCPRSVCDQRAACLLCALRCSDRSEESMCAVVGTHLNESACNGTAVDQRRHSGEWQSVISCDCCWFFFSALSASTNTGVLQWSNVRRERSLSGVNRARFYQLLACYQLLPALSFSYHTTCCRCRALFQLLHHFDHHNAVWCISPLHALHEEVTVRYTPRAMR